MPQLPVNQSLTNEQIMARLSQEPALYGLIMDRYTERLTRYIKRSSSFRTDELEDVLQEVFVRAYEKSASFNTSLSFNAWIYRICHNVVINHWKKNRRYDEGISFDNDEKGYLENMFSDNSTVEEIMREADGELIKSALLKIKDTYRAILILRFFEDQDYQEISDVLKMPPGTVATNIHRAKKALAKQVTLLEQHHNPKE